MRSLILAVVLFGFLCVASAMDETATVRERITEKLVKSATPAKPEVASAIADAFARLHGKITPKPEVDWFCKKTFLWLSKFSDFSMIRIEEARSLAADDFQTFAKREFETFPGDAACDQLEIRYRQLKAEVNKVLQKAITDSPEIYFKKSGRELDIIKACAATVLCNPESNGWAKARLETEALHLGRRQIEELAMSGISIMELAFQEASYRYTHDVLNVRFIKEELVSDAEFRERIETVLRAMSERPVVITEFTQFYSWAYFVREYLVLKSKKDDFLEQIKAYASLAEQCSKQKTDFVSFPKALNVSSVPNK